MLWDVRPLGVTGSKVERERYRASELESQQRGLQMQLGHGAAVPCDSGYEARIARSLRSGAPTALALGFRLGPVRQTQICHGACLFPCLWQAHLT